MEYPELLLKIKKKPGLYLNSFSLLSLKAFLDGYCLAIVEDKLSPILYQFQMFVVEKYDANPALSWDDIIRLYASSDQQAFDRFFELFEEFLNENKAKENLPRENELR